MILQLTTLGVMICEADIGVKETEGNNQGPRIREHALAMDPPIHVDVPWCAIEVQAASDIAAQGMGMENPLDAVRQEALVQSYHDWAMENAREILDFSQVERGDLVLYKFGRDVNRWNHIGLVAVPPVPPLTQFKAVEGNTPLEEAPEDEQRDSRTKVDGVAIKVRLTDRYPVTFIRWAP